jgi:hypothetical protein
MGNTCSSAVPVLPTKHRYTLVYSPLSEDILDALSHWVELATKYHSYANFNAINIIDTSNTRSLGTLPVVNPRKLPVVFAYYAAGKPPLMLPYDQIGAVETELKKLAATKTPFEPNTFLEQ